jgi:putative membrane protein
MHAEGRRRISAAVDAAEKRTAGEVVPVLARRSAPYSHVVWLASALAYILLAGSGWSLGPHVACWGVRAELPIDVVAALISGWGLAQFAWVRRALTSRRDQRSAVQRAAELAFHRYHLHQARHDAGILLYVSLDERQAVVLAGPGLHLKAGQAHWDQACRLLIQGAAKHDLAAGFEQAIGHVGAQMALAFPAKRRGAKAKLSDRLRIVHEVA